LKHCDEGKIAILEELNLKIDQNKKVEDELELAYEKMMEIEEALKNIE
jgi:hypothetical protein